MSQPYRLWWPWVAVASVCCVLMVAMPGEETVPYHVAWVAIAFAYGLDPWAWRRALVGMVALTSVSGFILVRRASSGDIAWGELTEIPLMGLLVTVVIVNVRRRHESLRALAEHAERDRARAARHERLSRMTSHELRTPATISMGFLELLRESEPDAGRRHDMTVVLEELERVLLGSDRLVRMLWIPEHDGCAPLDLDAVLVDVRDRWSVVANRDWQVRSTGGVQDVSFERVRSCLDTLIENSVRYTGPGDVIRLVSFVREGAVHIGVEDSGPGFDPVWMAAAAAASDGQVGGSSDPRSKTGLGLGLVREAIAIRGGRLAIGCSPEGGAQVLMVAPVRDWDEDAAVAPVDVVADVRQVEVAAVSV